LRAKTPAPRGAAHFVDHRRQLFRAGIRRSLSRLALHAHVFAFNLEIHRPRTEHEIGMLRVDRGDRVGELDIIEGHLQSMVGVETIKR